MLYKLLTSTSGEVFAAVQSAAQADDYNKSQPESSGASSNRKKPAEVDIQEVKSNPLTYYIKSGVIDALNLDKRDDKQRTYLHRAIKIGNILLATQLLDRGADPDLKDSSGKTPFHDAVRYGNLGLIKKLLKCNATLLMDNKRRYPLHEFARYGSVKLEHCHDVVRWITRNNHPEDLELADFRGNTALHEAAFRGNKVVVQALLNLGVNPLLCNSRNENVLLCMARGVTLQINKMLEELSEIILNKNDLLMSLLTKMVHDVFSKPLLRITEAGIWQLHIPSPNCVLMTVLYRVSQDCSRKLFNKEAVGPLSVEQRRLLRRIASFCMEVSQIIRTLYDQPENEGRVPSVADSAGISEDPPGCPIAVYVIEKIRSTQKVVPQVNEALHMVCLAATALLAVFQQPESEQRQECAMRCRALLQNYFL